MGRPRRRRPRCPLNGGRSAGSCGPPFHEEGLDQLVAAEAGLAPVAGAETVTDAPDGVVGQVPGVVDPPGPVVALEVVVGIVRINPERVGLRLVYDHGVLGFSRLTAHRSGLPDRPANPASLRLCRSCAGEARASPLAEYSRPPWRLLVARLASPCFAPTSSELRRGTLWMPFERTGKQRSDSLPWGNGILCHKGGFPVARGAAFG